MDRFEQSLVTNMGSFNLDLPAETVARLGDYYSLLTGWNDRLHLVAPCEPEEFAVRHVLESLLLLKYLPFDAHVADIGSGGGLPIIPCLIARADLEAILIESSQKKAVFLREVISQFKLRATVVAQPFEQVEPPPVSFVTCRALDRFSQKLPALIHWAPTGSALLLFGGEALGEQLGVRFEKHLIPLSDRRFLFILAAD
ncbi:MAG TPA: RsmG family class I SAM-dependent methyltransferase [Pyrinomonadaceae bacterium]|nr:RsmG family class I SAM-dependent methyltransferase [Pyrinomonadaceae bacterium]